jgi:hypothetical protein
MKDYYILITALFIAIASIVFAYHVGYSDGFTKGQSMCQIPIIEMEK